MANQRPLIVSQLTHLRKTGDSNKEARSFLMSNFIRVFIGLIALHGSHVLAGDLKAYLEPSTGTLDDSFTLRVEVEGRLESDITLPKQSDFSLSNRGRSSNVSIVNGAMTSKTIFYYELQVDRAGQYTIAPLLAVVDGKKLRTDPIEFNVADAGASVNGAGAGASHDGSSMPMAFVERRLEKQEVFVGEPFISQVKIYSRVGVSQLRRADNGSSDFRVESLDQANGKERLGDHLYRVYEFSEVLTAESAGTFELDPFVVEAGLVVPSERGRSRHRHSIFDEFFGGGFDQALQKRLRSKTDSVKVKPIPKEGRPAGYKGLVGDFNLQSELSDKKLNVGDTVTVTLTIRGLGYLDTLGNDLSLGSFDGIKIYPDKPETITNAGKKFGVASQRLYKFALVPTKPGLIDLGQFKLPYFDPKLKRFKTLTTDLGRLKVEGEALPLKSSDANGSLHTVKSQVKALNKDLIDIHRSQNVLESHMLKTMDYVLIYALMFLSLLGFLLSFGYVRLNYFQSTDLLKQKRSLAFKKFNKEKARLEKEQGSKEPNIDQFHQLYKSFRTYLGEKFDTHGGSLTSKGIDDCLKKAGLDQNFRDSAAELANLVDRLAFAGSQHEVDINGLLVQLNDIVSEVEKRY